MLLRAAALAVVVLLAWPLPSSGQAASPHLIINDVDVAHDASPLIQDDVLLLPAVLVARAFGAATAWDAAARTLTLTGAGGAVVRLVPGQTRAEVDGTRRDLPAAPVLRDGTLWAPALALLRALGAYVVDGDDGHTQIALAQVTNVSWRADGAGLAVRVSATGPVHVDTHLLHQPERLVVDLGGAIIRLSGPPQDIGIAGVLRVRGAQFQLRPFITRIVFDLDHAIKFTVAARPGEIVLALGDVAAVPAAQTPPVTAAPAPGSPAQHPSATSASPPTPVTPPAGGSAPPATSPSGTAGPGAPPSSAIPAVPAGPAVAAPHDASADSSGIAPEPLALPPLPEFADRPGAFHVRAVAYDDQDRAGRITIQASQRVTYALHQFVYPDRLAIDITGGVYLARRHDIEVGSEAVRNIVVSQFQLKPNMTRVLVHLYHKMPYSATVTDGGRTLVVTLGNPGPRLARGSAVVIDPGHGGADGGAVGPSGLREADVALAIARSVRDTLAGQGIPAVMTRTDDATVPLEERPDLAQRSGGIAFVSIHANASRSAGVAGTETYYNTPESQALARVVQAEVTQALGEPDRGVRTAEFYVLANTPMPSVLVETAFITNPAEEAMLRDPAVQRRIADAIARAIVKYLAAQRQPAAP
jgi:N-acetylmuramoyl-L-alanine amidase